MNIRVPKPTPNFLKSCHSPCLCCSVTSHYTLKLFFKLFKLYTTLFFFFISTPELLLGLILLLEALQFLTVLCLTSPEQQGFQQRISLHMTTMLAQDVSGIGFSNYWKETKNTCCHCFSNMMIGQS